MAGMIVGLIGLGGCFGGLFLGCISVQVTPLAFMISSGAIGLSYLAIKTYPPGPAGGPKAGENWLIGMISLMILTASSGVCVSLGLKFILASPHTSLYFGGLLVVSIFSFDTSEHAHGDF